MNLRRWDFWILFLILLLSHLWIWQNGVWPIHDTVFATQVFYTFYNDFFFHHELARWLPYGVFGIHSGYWQISYLTPSNYLFGLIGFLLRFKNAVLLFKISVFFEHVMLLIGTYLFGQELFRRRSTVFFLCLGMVLSSVWLLQIFWNFRIYYLFPLIFYFLLLCQRKGKPEFFWLSVIVLIFSLIGNLVYFAFLDTLLFLISILILFWKQFSIFLNLFRPTKRNIAAFIFALFSGALYILFATHAFQHLLTYNVNRDPFTHAVSLDTFLTYGRSLGWAKFLGFWFPSILSTPNYGDCTLYLGLLPLVFFIYGIFRAPKNREYVLFFFLFLFLSVFSLGKATFLSSLVYHIFPPIRYFRYIGQIGALIRMCALILSAMGFQSFLETLEQKNAGNPWAFLSVCAVSIIALMIFLDQINFRQNLYPRQFIFFSYSALLLLIFSFLSAWLIWKKAPTLKFSIGAIFLIFLCADLLLYNAWAAALWPKKFSWVKKEALEVSLDSFQKERSFEADFISPHTSEAIKLKRASGGDVLMVEASNFVQLDPCLPKNNENMMWMERVDGLIRKNWPAYSSAQSFNEFIHSRNASSFGMVMGCVSKLILIPEAKFADNADQAEQLFDQVLDYNSQVVLENVPSTLRSSRKNRLQADLLDKITVKDFSLNQLRLETYVAAPEAWLTYLDAYHPGWVVFVDHVKAPLAIANLAFKAVALTHGKHDVQFTFSDPIGRISGTLIAILSIFFSLFVLFLVSLLF